LTKEKLSMSNFCYYLFFQKKIKLKKILVSDLVIIQIGYKIGYRFGHRIDHKFGHRIDHRIGYYISVTSKIETDVFSH